MKTATSYTEWAAQQRAERSEGEPGLSPQARVAAVLAEVDGVLYRRAVQRRVADDVRARRDAREQFQARMAEVA